jgi:hypothetical protein
MLAVHDEIVIEADAGHAEAMWLRLGCLYLHDHRPISIWVGQSLPQVGPALTSTSTGTGSIKGAIASTMAVLPSRKKKELLRVKSRRK